MQEGEEEEPIEPAAAPHPNLQLTVTVRPEAGHLLLLWVGPRLQPARELRRRNGSGSQALNSHAALDPHLLHPPGQGP